MSLPHYRSLSTLAEQLASGETTSATLLEQFIARCERHNPALNAVIFTNLDAARQRARELDALRANGTLVGPLHGIPMTIKESFEQVGTPSTSGSPTLHGHRPKTNADSVQRLLDAGAIIYGKSNLPLWAGDWQSFNAIYGTTNNPWDSTRTCGGSSGGSAAALAAGMTPAELGSDIGGSIRTPSHFCGVYGHKPTHNITSLRGHIPGPPSMLSTADLAAAGPMANHAADLAILLDVLTGPRALQAKAWSLNLPSAPSKPLSEYRVAVWVEDALCPLSAEISERYETLFATLEAQGVQVDRVAPADLTLDRVLRPFLALLGSIMGTELPRSARDRLPYQIAELRQGVEAGVVPALVPDYLEAFTLSHAAWLGANERRVKLQYTLDQFFGDYDVLLTPIVPFTAPAHSQDGMMLMRSIETFEGTRHYSEHLPWIALATLCGLPATSAPIGIGRSNLPINIQIIGNHYADHTTIRFAQLLQAIGFGFQPPFA